MIETPTPREVAAQWFQRVWNEKDADAIFQLMTADARGYLEGGQTIIGPDEFRQFHTFLLTLFPDIRVEIVDIVQEGEKAVAHWRASGIHSGTALGLTATGRPYDFHGMTWLIVREGKIIEGHDSWNQGALMAAMAVA